MSQNKTNHSILYKKISPSTLGKKKWPPNSQYFNKNDQACKAEKWDPEQRGWETSTGKIVQERQR